MRVIGGRRFLHHGAAAASLAVLATVAGCSSPASDAAGAWKTWDSAGVRDYSFHLRSGCADDADPRTYAVPSGRFGVEVRDRQVTDVVALDGAARSALADGHADKVPSISGLFETLQDRAADGDSVRMRFAETDGHPTYVEIDPDGSRRGDSNCYRVTGYRPG